MGIFYECTIGCLVTCLAVPIVCLASNEFCGQKSVSGFERLKKRLPIVVMKRDKGFHGYASYPWIVCWREREGALCSVLLIKLFEVVVIGVRIFYKIRP